MGHPVEKVSHSKKKTLQPTTAPASNHLHNLQIPKQEELHDLGQLNNRIRSELRNGDIEGTGQWAVGTGHFGASFLFCKKMDCVKIFPGITGRGLMTD